MLVDICVQLMENSLKQDICSLDTYGVSVTDVGISQVQQCLPQEAQYASLCWTRHLEKNDGRLYHDDQVHQFLLMHVLHWLETLSWMRKVSEWIHAIASSERIALVSLSCSILMGSHPAKDYSD